MNPHDTPGHGGGFGPSSHEPPRSHAPPEALTPHGPHGRTPANRPFPGQPAYATPGPPPQGPPPQGPFGSQPSRPGRYGTGLVTVLAVIAVLAGASFLGGGMALGGMMTGRITADEEPEPRDGPGGESPSPTDTPSPTERPSPLEYPSPTEEPEPTEEPTTEPEELMSSADLVAELRRDFDISARQDITDEVCGSADEEEGYDLFQCTSSMDTDLVRVAAFESSGIAMLATMAMLESEDNTAEDIQDACHFVLVWFDHNGLDQGERDEMAEAAREIAGCP